jgi:hypothetical protein
MALSPKISFRSSDLMEIGEIEVPMATIMQNVTLRVTGIRGYAWRMWVAGKLLVAVAKVLKCKIEFVRDDDR